MKLIRELINGAKSGWYSGRGHKATRRGEYEKALHYYELALEYEGKEGKCGIGPNPVAMECIARSHARLGNLKEALIAAEKSQELYKQLAPNTKIVADCSTRVEFFIALLKAGNTDEINKFLVI